MPSLYFVMRKSRSVRTSGMYCCSTHTFIYRVPVGANTLLYTKKNPLSTDFSGSRVAPWVAVDVFLKIRIPLYVRSDFFLNYVTCLYELKESTPRGLEWSLGLQRVGVKLLGFLDNRHMMVARLLALRTGHLYSPGDTPSTTGRINLLEPEFCFNFSTLCT